MEITKLEHPELAKVVATTQGRVASIGPTTPVQVGASVFTIQVTKTDSRRAADIYKRINELEELVKQDPTAYRPFLARARRDLQATQRVSSTEIKAPAAGLIVSAVKVGDLVEVGRELGAVVDGQQWLAEATLQGTTPTASWSCTVSTVDRAHSAACSLRSTEAVYGKQGTTQVKISIQAADTPWLRNANQHPQVLLEPPSR